MKRVRQIPRMVEGKGSTEFDRLKENMRLTASL